MLNILKSDKKSTDFGIGDIENHMKDFILEQKYDLLLENGIPKQIVFYDTLGNKVEIVFQNAVINGTIDLNRFDFKPSAEIDIIYN